jgi:2-dehydropantoate 2-reductase
MRPIGAERHQGGSTWQSLARGHDLEGDYLNGEIVLLGRLHGVPTPVNTMLQRLGLDLAQHATPPGSMTLEQVEARLAGA